MIDICITRVPGCCEDDPDPDKCMVGDDISNNLIVTESAAASVARALIDTECSDREIVSSPCSIVPYLKPNSFVQAANKDTGAFKGRLNKFSISVSRKIGGSFSCKSSIEIEKEK